MIQERDYRLDNLKGILIILMVFAHVFERIISHGISSNPVILSLHVIINSFHMPVFIFISGFFSRSFRDKDKWATGIVRSVLIPYFVANTAYWLLDSGDVNTFMTSQFAMWYLLSLFFWRLLIHPLSKIRWLLVISVLFSLYVGFTKADKFLSLQRTVSFFPYFVSGFQCSKTSIEKIKNVNKFFCGFLMIVSFSTVVILTLNVRMPPDVLNMAYPYAQLEIGKGLGLIFRAIALLLGFSGILYTIALTPNKRSLLTELGSKTIVIYLLHPLFLRTYSKLHGPTTENTILIIIASLAATAIICAICNNRFVVRLYNNIMDKIASFVLIQN